jgi:hypothetical protein
MEYIIERDELVKCWERWEYRIEAESYEEAKEKYANWDIKKSERKEIFDFEVLEIEDERIYEI